MRRGRVYLLLALPLIGFLFVFGAGQLYTPIGASTSKVTPGPICVNCGGIDFKVQSYQGRSRCLDYKPEVIGSPVFLNDCALAHPVRVQEINDRHEVILHAGTLVIGTPNPLENPVGVTPFLRSAEFDLCDWFPRLPWCPKPGDTTSPTEYALELQNEANPQTTLALHQIFALDGDSIMAAANRDLVVQVQNARGANGSPLVVGPRNLADNEFWDFKATDGSDRDPTSGFKRVATRDDLLNAITEINQVARSNNGAAWGSVIKIMDTGQPITLTVHNLLIPTGVTVRGDRRGILRGPQLVGLYNSDLANIFQVQGDYVRITGLRLQGPSNCVADPYGCYKNVLPPINAIQVGDDNAVEPEPAGVIIDHNDMSDLPESTVNVFGNYTDNNACPTAVGASPNYAYIERNFIHHNENGDGYGIRLHSGGGALIKGNTFLMNRHSISADDGESHEGYTATFNLVLSNAPVYSGKREQDFDVHGSGSGSPHWYGGYAGNLVVIDSNTFLGGDRDNFDLRGKPCNAMDQFNSNVSMALWLIQITSFDGNTVDRVPINGSAPSSTPYMELSGNRYTPTNPAEHLGVGDFDGDGADDLFLATGTAWYYSPAGKAEWRFLSAKTDTMDHLLFGDFDGDGRTDVVSVDDQGNLFVSWGGISEWEKLNSHAQIFAPRPITDWVAVGDFDGNGYADIFVADGTHWWVSYGGNTGFMQVDKSSFYVKDLRFGDFDGDGKTDVFGVVSGKWQYEKSATSSWTPLRTALTSNVSGLIVADFNGDGYADVGANCEDSGCWRISYRGFEDWSYIPQPFGLVGPNLAGVGHFLGYRWADVLSWIVTDPYMGQDTLSISVAAISPTQRYSTQDMR